MCIRDSHDIYPQSHHNVQDSWVWYSSVCVFIVPTVIMVTTLALIFFQFYKNPTQEKLMTRGTRTSASKSSIRILSEGL